MLNRYKFFLLGCVGCASFSSLAAQTTRAACTYRYSQRSIPINGHHVAVEYYVPEGLGHVPLVFMLHGSAGAYSLRSSNEPPLDNFGEKKLARSCFAVVLPHYLEALGYKSMTSTQKMSAIFPQLLAIANTLLTDAETLPGTRGQPVFLFGESLGGYLCIALGLRRNEVTAISEISGGVPTGYMLDNPHRVALLISHGKDDVMVPVNNADELKRYGLKHHLEMGNRVYSGVGHYLPQTVETDCISRTIDFFKQHRRSADSRAVHFHHEYPRLKVRTNGVPGL